MISSSLVYSSASACTVTAHSASSRSWLSIAVGLYLLHGQSKGSRKQALIWLAVLTLISIIVFLPLARYWVENPEAFSFRAFSRLEADRSAAAGSGLEAFPFQYLERPADVQLG